MSMKESSVQQRKEEILSALKEGTQLKNYNIMVEPINGSGDMEIQIKGKNKWNTGSVKEGIVKYGQDITHLKDLFYS